MLMNRQAIYIQGVTYITTPSPSLTFKRLRVLKRALAHVVGVILNTFGHTSEFCPLFHGGGEAFN